MPERAAWALSGTFLSGGGEDRPVVPQVHAHALWHAPAEQQGRQRGLHLVADKAANLARAAPAVPAAQGKAAGKAVRQLQPDVQVLRALLQGCELLLCDLLKRRCTKRLKTRYAIDAPEKLRRKMLPQAAQSSVLRLRAEAEDPAGARAEVRGDRKSVV